MLLRQNREWGGGGGAERKEGNNLVGALGRAGSRCKGSKQGLPLPGMFQETSRRPAC